MHFAPSTTRSLEQFPPLLISVAFAAKNVYFLPQIANVLLHNKAKWDTGTELLGDDMDERLLLSERRPILVVCLTNHALDQFLEGIHKFHPKGIVRIGGRSKSEVMRTCSLSELKHKMHKVRVNCHMENELFFSSLLNECSIEGPGSKACRKPQLSREHLLSTVHIKIVVKKAEMPVFLGPQLKFVVSCN